MLSHKNYLNRWQNPILKFQMGYWKEFIRSIRIQFCAFGIIQNHFKFSKTWTIPGYLLFITRRILNHIFRWLSESMKNLWMRANTLTPRQLWTQTINNFSSKRNRDFEHFLEDPILAFQADSTIYQSPILIEIFLVAIKGRFLSQKTSQQKLTFRNIILFEFILYTSNFDRISPKKRSRIVQKWPRWLRKNSS